MKLQAVIGTWIVVLASGTGTLLAQSSAIGTAFTYQGRLNDNGVAANGSYSFRFRLIQPSNGQYQGPILTNQPVAVSNGLFTTTIDFGDYFGERVFDLEIGVRTNGSAGAFITLSPNQPIKPTPMATVANRAASVAPLPPSTLFYGPSDFPPFQVNSTSTVVNLNSDFLDGLGSEAFWKLGGNAGGSSTVLGTLDSRPLDLVVGGARGLRIDPAMNGGFVFPNIIGGAFSSISGTSAGTISGGRENTIDQSATATISGGWRNQIQSGGQDNTIGGGQASIIQQDGIANTIGGGSVHLIESSGQNGTVGGGRGNRLGAGVLNSTIGGGRNNAIDLSARNSTIGGGSNNVVEQASDFATIGGGSGNSVSFRVSGPTIGGGVNNRAASSYAAIAGGANNTVFNAGIGFFDVPANGSAIGGGDNNLIASRWDSLFSPQLQAVDSVISGGLGNAIDGASYAAIPGGANNGVTGSYGLAAGRRAKAYHAGSFVWADSTDADFASTGANDFSIRATGGVKLSDNTPNLSFGATTRQMLNLWGTQYGIGVQSSTVYFRCDNADPNNGFIWYRGGSHQNGYAQPGPGGTELMHLVAGGLYVNGTLVSTSDRNSKQDFGDVNSRDVLEKVAKLPLQTWSYKNDPNIKHVGPVAQDFFAAFAVGPDDKHIATVDADGVALAAIQGLNQKVEEQAREIQSKNQKLSELEKRLAALEQMIQSGKARD
jgi:hypothetical protein